jgi:hypothetical protein
LASSSSSSSSPSPSVDDCHDNGERVATSGD